MDECYRCNPEIYDTELCTECAEELENYTGLPINTDDKIKWYPIRNHCMFCDTTKTLSNAIKIGNRFICKKCLKELTYLIEDSIKSNRAEVIRTTGPR